MVETTLIEIVNLEPNTGQIEGVIANPRTITPERMEQLRKSVRELPDMMSLRELLVYAKGDRYVVLGGNQRLEACRELGWEKVPCKVIPDTTDTETLCRIAMLDNEPFGQTDWGALVVAGWDTEKLNGWGVEVPVEWQVQATNWNGPKTHDEPSGVSDPDEEEPETDETEEEDDDDTQDPSEYGAILDCLFPSDNDYEVPVLLKEQMAGRLELPVTPWGSNSRLRRDVNTYHFYVEDYRFEKLFKDPFNLIMSGVKSIVEPNCSLHGQTPVAFGLAQIYKKRWLARYCQERGIKVYVDLNVDPKFAEWNLLGVPEGWDAFMTRGQANLEDRLDSDLEIARRISGKETPNLIVYGGGRKVQDFCKKNGLLYVQDFINAKDI